MCRFRLTPILVFSLFFILELGLAGSARAGKADEVTIILRDGGKIKATNVVIDGHVLKFKAKSRRKAYEYGERLPVQRVAGIQVPGGEVLSVDEFKDYLKNRDRERKRALQSRQQQGEEDELSQYERLKKKPIAEMTENEFKFYMMMKERELAQEQEKKREEEAEKAAAQTETAPPVRARPRAPEPRSSGEAEGQSGIGLHMGLPPAVPTTPVSHLKLDDVARSLIDAGLAPDYLSYLHHKGERAGKLSAAEQELLELIESDPKWKETLDDLNYIDRVARKALSRAYLYNPEELRTKLNLKFDPDLDMDYLDLMEQLHRSLGDKVKMNDFRTMVDVLGEGGARAVKEILESYRAWKFNLPQSDAGP